MGAMMKAYRMKKKIATNGDLKLSALPFREGDEYLDPTEPVATEDWEILK